MAWYAPYMITKAYINDFLRKHNLTADKLSEFADVGRWSLRRYLQQKDTGINLRTADKLELAMIRLEREATNP